MRKSCDPSKIMSLDSVEYRPRQPHDVVVDGMDAMAISRQVELEIERNKRDH